jgi:hypothetical protein
VSSGNGNGWNRFTLPFAVAAIIFLAGINVAILSWHFLAIVDLLQRVSKLEEKL